MTHIELLERSAIVRKPFTYKGNPVKEYVHLAALNTRELLDFVETPISPSFQVSTRAIDKKGWGSFTGCDTKEQAIDLLRNGWPEGTKQAKEIAQRIFANLPRKGSQVILEPRMSVAPMNGVILDPVSLLRGLPTPFIGQFDSNRDKIGGRRFQIGVNTSALGYVDTSMLMMRAATVGALCQSLLTLGYSIGLTLMDVSLGYMHEKKDYARIVTSWKAVELGQHFSMDRLVFACGHPTAFRRFMFAMEEQTPAAYCGSWCSGYGSASDLRSIAPDMVDKFDLFVDSNECITPKGHTPLPVWTDAKEQATWIQLQLENQGVVFPKR